jgi:hypothetical protein
VYDIETFPNIFSVVFANDDTKKIWVFEISDRKDDSKKLRKFMGELYKEKARMVGFNNLGFDYPVIHWWLQNKGAGYKEIYMYAMDLINSSKDDKFGMMLPESKHFIQQLDLYKINHYDNKAKATSLKMLEFNMRSEEIEDLPFPVGRVLSDSEKDILIKYNRKDVLETLKFYRHCKEAIELRETLSEEYGMNCMNFNDTKIGKEYFIQQLERDMPGCCYTQTPKGRKINQTKRKSIKLVDIVFPYVRFESEEFNAVLDWIKRQEITETKGVFSDIPEHELGDLAKYCRLTEKKKKIKVENEADKETAKELRKQLKDLEKSGGDAEEIEKIRDKIYGNPVQSEIDKMFEMYPCGRVEREVLKSGKTSYYFKWNIAESLNVVIDGLEYIFGTGGIHASREGVTSIATEDRMIMDIDVASYYPNMFISNRVYPEHLSERFCDIYGDVYQKRKGYAKGSPQNAVMKLALNGVYGSSNDQYSPFYDPKATMAITVNGQLSLCMLTEMLMKRFPDIEFLQLNTDGETFMANRKDYNAIWEVIHEWEKVTGLTMEDALYSKMAMRDVNNYIAVYENGKYKRNGAYEYKVSHIHGEGLQFHQNQSMLIVKEAAFEAIVNNIPVEKTIKACKDPYAFCLRTKVPRNSRLVLLDEEGIEYPEQNICRYYIANDGYSMFKVMPPLEEGKEERWMGINKGQLVKICNKMVDFDWDINYDFYIEEAQKLVDGVGWKIN